MDTQRRASIRVRAAVVIGTTALVSVALAAPAWGNGKDREFAGYLVHRAGGIRAVAAEFTIPTITCKSNSQIALGPGVYLQQTTLDASDGVATGVYEEVECLAAGPPGSLYVGIFINAMAHKTLVVSPGDVIGVSIKRSGGKITVKAIDHTTKTTITGTGKQKKAETYALFGYYQPGTTAWQHPHTSPTPYTFATLNGAALSKAHPRAINCVRGHTVQFRPSKITHGEDFTINFVHS